ncbi:cysteine-rich motor neuron 1 protein-like [Montipora capricornis]|uniref:cysteine-rich motor neuron 1 protein-like n=1 Tax=Montipora capricornis TaxID=246305 RepID=UPI0035F1193A
MDSRVFLQALMVLISIVILTTDGKSYITKEARESKTIAVRDVNVEVSYIPVDCFSDSRKNRSLEKLVKSFRGNGWIWKYYPNMTHVIQACAEEAFKKGYKIVGIQFYGECWSSKNENYMFRRKSKNCFNGVGKQNANYVYRLVGNPIQPKAADSTCNVDGYTFTDGQSMEVYNGNLVNGVCDQCTCQNGLLVDCHHIFHCVLNDSSCDRYVKRPDQCCPACERDVPKSAPVCSAEGKVYKQGESMEILKDMGQGQMPECRQCTCMDGKMDYDCHRIYYCKPDKLDCGAQVQASGQCCPECARVITKPPPPSCKVGGRDYKHGASMEVFKMSEVEKEGSCDQCLCNRGELTDCHHLFNCSLKNPNCIRYVQKPEQCCPECVSAQPNKHASGCKILGELYKDGESAEVLMESADKSVVYCQQCRCKAGKHTCHKIYDCDIQNGACEKSFKIPGQCCPVCACYHNGTQLGPDDKWQKLSGSNCIECTCQDDGSANCTRVEKGACQSE